MRLLICLFFAFSLCQAEKISLATWNIRTITKWDSNNGHDWKDRMPHIVSLIQTYDFDILAMQEISEKQLVVLKKELGDYSFISAGRDDGALRGEALGILYKAEKLELLESGHFWLSETPNSPSVGWDGEGKKICVWAIFMERDTRVEFMVYSVHLDHKGELARINGTQQIIDFVSTRNMPTFVLGDFNVLKHSSVYDKMLAAGFIDAEEKAKIRYTPSGTYNRYTFNRKIEDVPDMIFISKSVPVEYYGILNNFFWQENTPKHISDHYPVLIRFEMEK